MPRAPIERKTLPERVYKALLRKILDGSLKPGENCARSAFAKAWASAAPLARGMFRLAREGLLERLPNKGCKVRERSRKEIEDLMEFRAMLECLALRRGFRDFDRAAFSSLRERLSAAKDMPLPQGRKEILSADEEMHELIQRGSVNLFLGEQILKAQCLCAPYRVFRCEASEDLAAIANERLGIVDAILADDMEAALTLFPRTSESAPRPSCRCGAKAHRFDSPHKRRRLKKERAIFQGSDLALKIAREALEISGEGLS
jgi:DNA-binding GntR family transcriptional regulator